MIHLNRAPRMPALPPPSDAVHGLLDRYWGKSRIDGDMLRWHPLVLHSLDVCATAQALLDERPDFVAYVASVIGAGQAAARALIIWLAAVHDLGKFAENFQYKNAQLAQALGHTWHNDTTHHSEVGYAVWRRLLDEGWATHRGLPRQLIEPLMHASTAHHGTPVSEQNPAISAISEAARSDAQEFADWAYEAILAAARLADPMPGELAASSTQIGLLAWQINGFLTLADWLGSDAERFVYARVLHAPCARPLDLHQYWSKSLEIARMLVVNTRLGKARPTDLAPTSVVFPGRPPIGLRPSQLALRDLPLDPKSPPYFVLEDATGSGKTEAAMILTMRLLQAGRADGLYFALPTTATANGMYKRMERVVSEMFRAQDSFSMVLTHSQAALKPEIDRIRQIEGYEDSAGEMASEWLANHRKAALLAHIGVGTIDQALLAVLRVKHGAMRLHGLFRKVLVIDEVHAYDRYQTELLCNLLKAHAATGGPAILLSATLAAATRDLLTQAYWQGFQTRPGVAAAPRRRAFDLRKVEQPSVATADREILPYPCLTRLTPSGSATHQPIRADLTLLRDYDVSYHTTIDAVIDLIVCAAKRGRCVAWVRNTVSDAQAAYQRINARLAAEDADDPLLQRVCLFHARFALIDRIHHENNVLRWFGKSSTRSQRCGRILVATQVIEQSLDLDFDELFTDLAPIDLLIQRAGRLRRHARDTCGNPLAVGMQDERGPRVLNVLGPARDQLPADARWLSDFSRGTALIYPHHGRIWLSARALGDRLNLSRDPRGAIEAVYSRRDWPTVFDPSADKAEGAGYGDAQLAGYNSAPVLEEFRRDAGWRSEERAPTRIGDESVEVALCTQEDGQLIPYSREGSTMTARWLLSIVRVRPNQVRLLSGLENTQIDNRAKELFQNVPALRYRVLGLIASPSGRLLCRVAKHSSDAQRAARPISYDRTLGVNTPAKD